MKIVSISFTILFLLPFSLFSNQEGLTFRQENFSDTDVLITAYKDKKAIGFIILSSSPSKFSKKAEIHALHVKPEFRKKGVATALINEARKVVEKEQYEKIKFTAQPFGLGNASKMSHSDLLKFYQKRGAQPKPTRVDSLRGTHMVYRTPYYYSHYFKNLKRYFPVTMNPFE